MMLSTKSPLFSTKLSQRRTAEQVRPPEPRRTHPATTCVLIVGWLLFLPLVLFIVVDVQGVDEITEERQSLIGGCVGIWFVSLSHARGRSRCTHRLLIGCGGFLLVEEHTGSLKDMRFDIDRRIGANRERDRIAGTGVDLNRVAALLDDDPRKEGAILDVMMTMWLIVAPSSRRPI